MNDFLIPIVLAVLFSVAVSGFLVWLLCRWMEKRATVSNLKKKTDASGKRGEEQLLQEVRKYARVRRSKVLTNVYLTTAKGKSTEVDLVLLDRNGIFIFESKNYNGLVLGKEDNRYWLHVLRNGDKFSFFNPIWQNRGHLTAVKKICGDLDHRFYKSIIVFGKNSRFKRFRLSDPNVRIVRYGQVRGAIHSLSAHTHNCLSYRDILTYYEKLLPYTRSTKRQKKMHVKEVRKNYR